MRLTREERVPGMPRIDVIIDATGGIVMMRTFIVRDRLYRLLVTAKTDLMSRSAASRFLSSLRLAETKP